ncbi:MAG: hypothetical protein H7326_06930 [Bdellovibrionaceae bacterium]|nr:hypothetical protein [Pseudobdellovibrionaceae bacterium]
MPTIKDYEKKKKARRRRPGREDGETLPKEDVEVEVGDADEMFDADAKAAFADRDAEAQQAFADPEADAQAAFGFESTSTFEEGTSQARDFKKEEKKIHIEFPYSEMIRARAPKFFEVAETVATDWVNDGNFENVPVGHPVAQMTVAAGLRKAKEVEKKLEEKGVFMMAKMGLEFAKSKLKR